MSEVFWYDSPEVKELIEFPAPMTFVKDIFTQSMNSRLVERLRTLGADAENKVAVIKTKLTTKESESHVFSDDIMEKMLSLFAEIEVVNTEWSCHTAYEAYAKVYDKQEIAEGDKNRAKDALWNTLKARWEYWLRQMTTLSEKSWHSKEYVLAFADHRKKVCSKTNPRSLADTEKFNRWDAFQVHKAVVLNELSYDHFDRLNLALKLNTREQLKWFWNIDLTAYDIEDILTFIAQRKSLEDTTVDFDTGSFVELLRRWVHLEELIESKKIWWDDLDLKYINILLGRGVSLLTLNALKNHRPSEEKMSSDLLDKNMKLIDYLTGIYNEIPSETTYTMRCQYEQYTSVISTRVDKPYTDKFFEEFQKFREVWKPVLSLEDHIRLVDAFTEAKKTISFQGLTKLVEQLRKRQQAWAEWSGSINLQWDKEIYDYIIKDVLKLQVSPEYLAKTLESCPRLGLNDVMELLKSGFTLELLSSLVELRPAISKEDAFRMFKAVQTHLERDGMIEEYEKEYEILGKEISPFFLMNILAHWGSFFGETYFTFDHALSLLPVAEPITTTKMLNSLFERIQEEGLMKIVKDRHRSDEIISLINYAITEPENSQEPAIPRVAEIKKEFEGIKWTLLKELDTLSDPKIKYTVALLLSTTVSYNDLSRELPAGQERLYIKKLWSILLEEGHLIPKKDIFNTVLNSEVFWSDFEQWNAKDMPVCEILSTAAACANNIESQTEQSDKWKSLFGSFVSEESSAKYYDAKQDSYGVRLRSEWDNIHKTRSYKELFNAMNDMVVKDGTIAEDEANEIPAQVKDTFGEIYTDIMKLEQLTKEKEIPAETIINTTLKSRKEFMWKTFMGDKTSFVCLNGEDEGLSFNLFESGSFADKTVIKSASKRGIPVLSAEKEWYDEVEWFGKNAWELYKTNTTTFINSHWSSHWEIGLSAGGYIGAGEFTLGVMKEAKSGGSRSWKEPGIVETQQCNGNMLAEEHFRMRAQWPVAIKQPLSIITYTPGGKVHKISGNSRTRFFNTAAKSKDPVTVQEYVTAVSPWVFGNPVERTMFGEVADDARDDLTWYYISKDHAHEIAMRNGEYMSVLLNLMSNLEKFVNIKKSDADGLYYDKWILPYRDYFKQMRKELSTMLAEGWFKEYVVKEVF